MLSPQVEEGGKAMEVCTTNLVEGAVALTLTTPFCILGILGNAIVCMTISFTPSLRKSCNILICNLAATDLLTLLIVEPLICAILVYRIHGDCVEELVRAARALGYFFCCASILTITAMSLDRGCAVLLPLRYKVFSSIEKVTKIVVIIWILSTAAGLIEGFKVLSRSVCSLVTRTFILIFYAIILLCYLSIFIKMKKQARIRAQLRCGNNQENSRKTEKNVVKTILLVTGIFSVCWASFFYSILENPDQAFEDPLFRWSAMVGVASSAVNPVVYFYSNKDFRKAAKALCQGKKSSKDKQPTRPKPVLNNQVRTITHHV